MAKFQNQKIKVNNYDENDDENLTKIEGIVLLRYEPLKFGVIIRSLLTLMMYPVYLYWNTQKRMEELFSEAEDIESATHVFVFGSHEKSDEIVQLDRASRTFTYRFLKYRYEESVKAFIPIVFDIDDMSFKDILHNYQP